MNIKKIKGFLLKEIIPADKVTPEFLRGRLRPWRVIDRVQFVIGWLIMGAGLVFAKIALSANDRLSMKEIIIMWIIIGTGMLIVFLTGGRWNTKYGPMP